MVKNRASHLILLIICQILFVLAVFETGLRLYYHNTFTGLIPTSGGEVEAECRALLPDRHLNKSRIPGSVVVLGASSMAGYAIQKEELTASLLESRYGIPTINLASPAASSFELLKCVEDIAPLHPRVVLIYYGHSDQNRFMFRFEKNPANIRFIDPHPRVDGSVSPFRRLETALVENSYLAFWAYMRSRALASRFDWQLKLPSEHYKKLFFMSTDLTYTNFRRINNVLSPESIPLVMMTLVSNIRSRCGGTIVFENVNTSISSCDLTKEGERALSEGDRQRALYLYKAGMSIARRFGDYTQMDYEGATPHVNEMIREFARDEGLILVDTEQHFDALFLEDKIEYGDDLFFDSIHPNPKAHSIMAEMLAPVLQEYFQAQNLTA